jgi:hypothetical protein
LELRGCYALTDSGAAALAAAVHLTALDVHGCSKLTDEAMRALGALPALNTLDVSHGARLTDAAAAHLKHLTSLTTLDLSSCSKVCGKQKFVASSSIAERTLAVAQPGWACGEAPVGLSGRMKVAVGS